MLTDVRRIYAVAAYGVVLVFLGHGLFAATLTNAKFPPLFSGTLKHAFNLSVSTNTAERWVQTIGWVDLALALVFLILAIGATSSRGLFQFAVSKVALWLFAWAAIWGFLTALARPVSAGAFWPDVLDFIERGPNFMLPIVAFMCVQLLRKTYR